MDIQRLEKFRAARDLLVALRTSSAKEVRQSWADLFDRPIDQAKGKTRGELADEISAELQLRLKLLAPAPE